MRRTLAQVLVANGRVVTTYGYNGQSIKGSLKTTLSVLNDWKVDEIIVTEINGSLESLCELLSESANICRTPICAGGGIKSVDDVKHLLKAGADRVHITSLFTHCNWTELSDIVKFIGGQAIIWKLVYGEEYIRNTVEHFSEYISRRYNIVEDMNINEVLIWDLQSDGGRQPPRIVDTSSLVNTSIIVGGGYGLYPPQEWHYKYSIALGSCLYLGENIVPTFNELMQLPLR
ncbi:HisA/HisF-related TIM barrel protein [bacterium]|nr:HisA/HisF-related TIM barrel protein [bacterium]